MRRPWLVREAQWGFWLALAAGLLFTGLLGSALEALVLRHLYRRSELDQVLFTIGLSFFLIATLNALAGPQVQLIPLPPLLAQSVDLGFRTLPAQRLLVIGPAGCWLCGERGLGGQPAPASACGCAPRWTTPAPPRRWASPSAAGAVHQLRRGRGPGGAGRRVLGAELMPLEPYYALKYLVLVLVVVAVGGMGSIAGLAAGRRAAGHGRNRQQVPGLRPGATCSSSWPWQRCWPGAPTDC